MQVSLGDEGLKAQLGGVAARLIDIAACVAREAETATAVVRGLTDQARDIASLAIALEEAAGVLEASVRRQADMLAAARVAVATGEPAIAALTVSADSVAAIADTIARIARESQMLSLNARIEAHRAGDNGRSFAVVASEMSNLTSRTKRATDEIGERARLIAGDVDAAHALAASHGDMVSRQEDMLATVLTGASHQRNTAAALSSITAGTAATVGEAATAIGRVGANAVAVKLLARQLTKMAS